MKGKKLAAKMMLGLLLATPYGFANKVEAEALQYTSDANVTDNIEASENFPGGKYLNTVLVSGEGTEVNLTGNSISSTMTVNQNFTKDYTFSGITAGSLDGENGAELQLGGKNTKNIIINTYVNGQNTTNGKGLGAVGLWALNNYQSNQVNNGGLINVNGENLNITVHAENSSAYGILAQNSTTGTTAKTPSTININTENTKIVATSGIEGGASGIVALSEGVVNINSNLEVDSDNAIVARGDAIVKINEAGERTTKLNGDINFNYDKATSGTKVDADVLVNLTGTESYWNGNAIVSWGTGAITDEEKAKVSGLDLIVADGAQWNPIYIEESSDVTDGRKTIAINKLTANDGVINLDNMKDQEVRIENLSGKKLNVNVASADNKLAITEKNDIDSLTVAAKGAYAEELVQNDITDSLNNLANQVVDNSEKGKGKTAATDVAISETGVVGEITAEVGEDGKVDATTVKELTNSTTAGIGELANVAFMAWRAENDEMHQRMGELRSSTGEAGIWARMKRGESESGDLNIKNQYSTYQLGYDEKVGDSNWYLGGAISRTEGKSSFGNGSGENQSTGFTVYGTYVGEDGQYVDLSAKYARLDNEFDVFGRDGIESTGDYRNNGYAFSAEYGKRIEAGNEFWVEPQVQLTYGHLSSADYTTSRGIKAAQDAMNSVVGRVGFAAGKDIGAGNVYVKASYLYDFDGDTSVTMNDGVNSRTYEQDLGGGWFEFGIGTNINLSETSHLYFDVERAVGGDIDTPWQWNAGVRFDF
jgi:outer membrane autotransporter protein